MIRLELENFLTQILYYELMSKVTGKFVFLCQDLMMSHELVEILSQLLFEKYQFSKIYYLLSNTLPLYITQQNSGVVLDVGYSSTKILPVYEGYGLVQSYELTPVGGYAVSRELKRSILDDNLAKSVSSPTFQELEDVKFKMGSVLQLQQKNAYFSSPSSIDRMKETFQNFNKRFDISYYSLAHSFEILFGDTEAEEENVAASLLRCLKKVETTTAFLLTLT